MTDTERLNLIWHYNWKVECCHTYCIITGYCFVVKGVNLREAFDLAYDKQAKRALSL